MPEELRCTHLGEEGHIPKDVSCILGEDREDEVAKHFEHVNPRHEMFKFLEGVCNLNCMCNSFKKLLFIHTTGAILEGLGLSELGNHDFFGNR